LETKTELKNSGKIERRFLLRRDAGSVVGEASATVHLGCLGTGGYRETFVGRIGRDRFLLVREGRGRFLRESTVPLGARAFGDLWRLVGEYRIQKKSRFMREGGRNFRVESMTCGNGVVSMAVFGFPTRAMAAAFVPPDFVGAETTGLEEYSDAHLALHGIPPPRNGRSQAGALPFLFRNGVLHVVLVTSSSGTRWIVPKGGLEKGMTRQEVALMESAEEAGAIGVLEPGIKAQCRMDDGRTLHLYPLRVATLLPHWPERLIRRRVVIPIYRALLRVRDVGMAEAIRGLGRRLEP
jgi:8-oxo-dGTP pyrophosphatase MutT (NUDIX family)/CYTH domain-containing protein